MWVLITLTLRFYFIFWRASKLFWNQGCIKYKYYISTPFTHYSLSFLTLYSVMSNDLIGCGHNKYFALTSTLTRFTWQESHLAVQVVHQDGLCSFEEIIIFVRVMFAEIRGQAHLRIAISQYVVGRLGNILWKTQKVDSWTQEQRSNSVSTTCPAQEKFSEESQTHRDSDEASNSQVNNYNFNYSCTCF